VEAHAVAALDVIIAFAVPNPGCSSRAVGFFGFGGSMSCLIERVTQPTLDRFAGTGLFGRRQLLQ